MINAMICVLLSLGWAQDDLSVNTIHFTIQEGTKDFLMDWNDPEDPVIAYVGDTLVITNEDNQRHQLHTYGRRPCEHGRVMEPYGGTWSCVLSQEYNAFEEQSPTRDHFNSSLKFWIIVLPAEERPLVVDETDLIEG
jgi:hypothetical protein